MAAELDGKSQVDGGIEAVRFGHDEVAAAPEFLQPQGDVSEVAHSEGNEMVKKGQEKRDGVPGELACTGSVRTAFSTRSRAEERERSLGSSPRGGAG